MALLDVLVKRVAYEMILCVVVPNIPVHVIVFGLNLGSVVVLLSLVLELLWGSLQREWKTNEIITIVFEHLFRFLLVLIDEMYAFDIESSN